MKWRTILLLLIGSMMMACAPIKPWERGILMSRAMRPADTALQAAMNNHVHTTRETAQGAAGEGELSCGCN